MKRLFLRWAVGVPIYVRAPIYILIGIFLGSVASWIAEGQTFPLTVKAYWNPNPVTDSVTGYTLTVDGGSPIAVGPVPTNDANCLVAQYPAGCIMSTVSIAAAGQHTFAVTATNQWATSAPATVTINVNSPGQIVWVKVTK